jgi:hypothetical protein
VAKKTFNLSEEIQRAWDWCWAYYCEPTLYHELEYDDQGLPTGKTVGEPQVMNPRQSYLTATDLERRVRAAVAETAYGAEYGSYGPDAWGKGPASIRISTGHGSLLDAVRSWLQSNRKLTAHNFGRGHISGARYRPIGHDLTAAEKSSIETSRKRRNGETPLHYRGAYTRGYPRPLCTADRIKPGYSRPSRSSARMTSEAEKVTCPRCKKLLAQEEALKENTGSPASR